jgi:hypothetical protein
VCNPVPAYPVICFHHGLSVTSIKDERGENYKPSYPPRQNNAVVFLRNLGAFPFFALHAKKGNRAIRLYLLPGKPGKRIPLLSLALLKNGLQAV